MKVLVPNTTSLEVSTKDELVPYDVGEGVPPEHADADVLIVWQNPEGQLALCAEELRSLRLVQTLASGADAVLAAGFDPGIPVCSGRSLHDGPVAEHALALTLTTVRRLDRLQQSQKERKWDMDYVRAQCASETQTLFTLDGARVTIWGFGSIANRLAPVLASLGADVRGIATTAGDRSGFPVHAETHAQELLRSTDILIALTPATPKNLDMFNEQIFSALPFGSIFINVGRGATVDEDALVDALTSGQLRAAAIDVSKDEPLSPDSILWSVPNLVITPHVAGNRPSGAHKLVATNLNALRTGGDLVNRVLY